MKSRERHVKAPIARQRRLRAQEALAELERAQKILLQSDKARGHHLNDDKSPLIDLMNCIICRQTMKIEKSSPDAEGKGEIIQYRCRHCDRIERLRLFRRSRDATG
jgi:hypothetical protein